MREQTRHSQPRRGGNLQLLAMRGLLFALLWWLLSEGDASSWSIGLPLVVLATLLSARLAPPTRHSLVGLLRFIPFFIIHSLRGGIDVARRALHPDLPIHPLLEDYPLSLTLTEAQVFLANVASLLPGTLSVRLENDRLQLHVLDGNGNYHQELQHLERRVAALFRLSLREDGNGHG